MSVKESELCGPGGCARELCQKHGVPLIHTITEVVLCAVCETAQVNALTDRVIELEAAIPQECGWYHGPDCSGQSCNDE